MQYTYDVGNSPFLWPNVASTLYLESSSYSQIIKGLNSFYWVGSGNTRHKWYPKSFFFFFLGGGVWGRGRHLTLYHYLIGWQPNCFGNADTTQPKNQLSETALKYHHLLYLARSGLGLPTNFMFHSSGPSTYNTVRASRDL